MRCPAALVLVLAAGCADPAVSGDRRAVIGGSPTAAGAFPATGALMYSDGSGSSPGCTGTLIAPDAVLTAAHCLDPLFTGGAVPSFTLALDANAATPADVVAGREAHQHPSFDIDVEPGGLGDWYDIGVLLLASPIDDVPPEILPTPEEAASLSAGQTVLLVGYGLTSNDSYDLGVKYDGAADLVQVASSELLISQPGQQQNCNGDSGGPALVDLGGGRRLVGTVSRSPDGNLVCDHGGVDTRVDAYLDFIDGLVDVPCGGLAGDCGGGEGGCGCRGSGGAPGALLLVAIAALLLRRRGQGAST